uniref:Uncharacterized protein n=1 Tax=Trichogramma kaykai TaxID=54128 RepID=A0ABD2XCF7_9HYME
MIIILQKIYKSIQIKYTINVTRKIHWRNVFSVSKEARSQTVKKYARLRISFSVRFSYRFLATICGLTRGIIGTTSVGRMCSTRSILPSPCEVEEILGPMTGGHICAPPPVIARIRVYAQVSNDISGAVRGEPLQNYLARLKGVSSLNNGIIIFYAKKKTSQTFTLISM